jgi:hypothetical protein
MVAWQLGIRPLIMRDEATTLEQEGWALGHDLAKDFFMPHPPLPYQEGSRLTPKMVNLIVASRSQ